MAKKSNLFPIDKKRLLPEDSKLLEQLEKGEISGEERDFERMLDVITTTPVSKLKSAQVARKRSGQAKLNT